MTHWLAANLNWILSGIGISCALAIQGAENLRLAAMDCQRRIATWYNCYSIGTLTHPAR